MPRKTSPINSASDRPYSFRPVSVWVITLASALVAQVALSQGVTAFLHRFSAGEPVSAQKMNHNFDTLRASLLPVGTVLPFAGETIPPGFLRCDGQTVSDAEFPELALALGDAWGRAADGFTVLPDLRGRFLRGAHDTTGTDPSGNRAVGSFQGEQLGYHAHGVYGHSHNVNVGNVVTVYYYAAAGTGSAQVRGLNDEGARGTSSAGSSTDGVGGETRPDNAAVQYIVRAHTLVEP